MGKESIIEARSSTDSFSMRSPAAHVDSHSFHSDYHDDVLRKASFSSSAPATKSRPRRKFLTKGGALVAKWVFLILCSLYLMVFVAFIALAIFLWVTDIGGVFHLTFKTVLLISGFVGLGISLAGIVGVTIENRGLLIMFFVFLLFMFIGQLGFVIFLIARRDALSLLLATSWEQAADSVKNNIQAEFECCGYTSPTNFPGSNCQADWTEGCIVKIKASLSANALNVVGSTCTIVFLELAGLLLSCFLIFRVPSNKQRIELELEEAWLRTLGDEPEPLDLF